MISYQQALVLLEKTVQTTPVATVNVLEAANHSLASDVIAPIDHPIFNQSAMDGYAFRWADLEDGNQFELAGEIAAGSISHGATPKGNAWRIFTGAPVPEDCDTVIMQEGVQRKENTATFDLTKLEKGSHVRLQGEQIRTGETALAKGTLLDAAAVGFLLSLGIESVQIHVKPSISICATGSEFAQNKADLKQGKIYESNSGMLLTVLNRKGFQSEIQKISDDEEAMLRTFGELANKHDVLVFTGGVSVGKYDYTKPTLEKLGFEEVFHKVRQKPGKPLLFMKKGKKLAFGLPGNPRAALLCFYIYVLPALRMSVGASRPYPKKLRLPLQHDLKKATDRAHFIGAELDENGVSVSGGQGSHMLQSMTGAQGLMIFDDDRALLPKGTIVDVLLLPSA